MPITSPPPQKKNRKAETYTIKKNSQLKTQETAKNESNSGFKKGMLGKFVSKKQANISQGNGKQRKIEENQQKGLLKGVDDKKQRQMMEFWKEYKRRKRKKTE